MSRAGNYGGRLRQPDMPGRITTRTCWARAESTSTWFGEKRGRRPPRCAAGLAVNAGSRSRAESRPDRTGGERESSSRRSAERDSRRRGRRDVVVDARSGVSSSIDELGAGPRTAAMVRLAYMRPMLASQTSDGKTVGQWVTSDAPAKEADGDQKLKVGCNEIGAADIGRRWRSRTSIRERRERRGSAMKRRRVPGMLDARALGSWDQRARRMSLRRPGWAEGLRNRGSCGAVTHLDFACSSYGATNSSSRAPETSRSYAEPLMGAAPIAD